MLWVMEVKHNKQCEVIKFIWRAMPCISTKQTLAYQQVASRTRNFADDNQFDRIQQHIQYKAKLMTYKLIIVHIV